MPNPEQGVLVQISAGPSFASCYSPLLSMQDCGLFSRSCHTTTSSYQVFHKLLLCLVHSPPAPSSLQWLMSAHLQILAHCSSYSSWQGQGPLSYSPASCLPGSYCVFNTLIRWVFIIFMRTENIFSWFCPAQPGNQQSAEHRVHLSWCKIVSNVYLHFTKEKMGTQEG